MPDRLVPARREEFKLGPLNGDFFLRANITLDEFPLSDSPLSESRGKVKISLLPSRTKRTFEGNAPMVGVVGSTLIDGCGDRALLRFGLLIVSMLFEDTDDALLCRCILRTDETEEDVDFLPLRPNELCL